MNIANFRVDDRLVHGVVSTNWVPSLGIQRVLVIDKESSENQMLKSALRMATPKGVFLSTLDPQTAISNLLADKYGDEKMMIVVKSPQRIIELVDAGIVVDKLVLGNLGNITKTDDTVAITKYVSINDESERQIEYLNSKGVNLVAQLVPKDNEIDFVAQMRSKRK